MNTKRITIKFIQIAILWLSMLSGKITFAQPEASDAIVNYIKTYAPLAAKEMNRTGVPVSIKLAQGLLETGAGLSDLVSRSNNHFGIKCKSSWTGEKVYHDDDAEGECFRKYDNAEASYLDHSNYLKSQPRYAFLFEYDQDDYKAWAWGLKKAGYATSPTYPQQLIKYIENYSLDAINSIAEENDEEKLSEYLSTLSTHTTPSLSKNSEEEPASVDEDHASKNILSKLHFKRNQRHKVHVVKKGDSLSSISKKYHVSIPKIKKANSMRSDRLQVGQKIKITK
jgi:LysM repeat protein